MLIFTNYPPVKEKISKWAPNSAQNITEKDGHCQLKKRDRNLAWEWVSLS